MKAFGHNGYFKSLKDIVHFYNTRLVKPNCAMVIPNIADPTAEEAIDHDCWPQPEFSDGLPPPNRVGNLGLCTDTTKPDCPFNKEADLVAYMKALSDGICRRLRDRAIDGSGR